jgi:hypothetical protein
MIRKFSALLAALAFTAVTIAPAAEARDHRRDGYYSGRHYRDYDRRYRHDDDDALAAGAIGLVLGLAIGSLASQPRQPRYDNGCYDRCAPPPPPRCYDRCGHERDSRYDPRYDDRRGSAYEDEYGLEGGSNDYYEPSREQCTRRERQWDRYANRYVVVDVPAPC